MIKNLPQWYRIATIDNITEDTLEKRSLAISKLLENAEEDFYFDCVRLYLGKKPMGKEFNNNFFKAFNEKDAMFLQDAPVLENRILAGAFVAQMFLEESDFGDQLAYVLINASFGLEATDFINYDIIERARDYLKSRAESERTSLPPIVKAPVFKEETPSAENLPSYIKSIATYTKGIAAYTEKIIKNNQKRIERLQEESDIHWWLFRSFSDIRKVAINSLPPNEAPFILALELSKLITIIPAPGNTVSFLNKSLQEINQMPDVCTIKKVAETLSQLNGDFGDILNDERYSNLIPLTFALAKRTEAEGEDAWTSTFKLNTKIDAEKEFSTQEIAFQLLNELILLTI